MDTCSILCCDYYVFVHRLFCLFVGLVPQARHRSGDWLDELEGAWVRPVGLEGTEAHIRSHHVRNDTRYHRTVEVLFTGPPSAVSKSNASAQQVRMGYQL